MIFAWPDLLTLHRKRTALARDELVKLLTHYQDTTDYHVVAVFDGKGEETSQETAPGGIHIFYSARSETADQIVERLAAKYAEKHDLVVATSDRKEEETVLSFGASCISTDQLRRLLDAAEADFQRRLKTHRRP